jgi:hypothetical protein
MANEQITAYIKQCADKGMDKEAIRSALTANGWGAADIEPAMNVVFGSFSTIRPIPSVTPPPSPGDRPVGRIMSRTTILPSATGLLVESWQIFTAHPGLFFGIQAVQSGLALVLWLGLSVIKADSSPLAILAVAGVSLIIQILTHLALIYAASKRGATSFGEAFARAGGKFFPAVWVGILSTFVVTGFTALLVIPGLIAAIWYLFSTYALVIDDQRGLSALRRSRNFVSELWWPILGYSLFILIVCSPVFIVFFLISTAFGMNGNAGGAIGGLFVGPLSAIYISTLYNHLKEYQGAAAHELPAGGIGKHIIIAFIGWLFGLLFFGGSFVRMFSTIVIQPQVRQFETSSYRPPSLNVNDMLRITDDLKKLDNTNINKLK